MFKVRLLAAFMVVFLVSIKPTDAEVVGEKNGSPPTTEAHDNGIDEGHLSRRHVHHPAYPGGNVVEEAAVLNAADFFGVDPSPSQRRRGRVHWQSCPGIGDH